MKQLKEQNQQLVETSRAVLLEVRDMAGEVRELRRDLNTREETASQLLQQIVDKLTAAAAAVPPPPPPAPPAAPAETPLSEEERLLLESFGVGVGQPPPPPHPSYAAAALYPLLQQQQLMFNMAAVAAAQQQQQQQLVAQQMIGPQFGSPARPLMAPSAVMPMYHGGLYGSGVHLPSTPAPAGPVLALPTPDFGLSVQQKESIFAAAGVASSTPPLPTARPRETGPPTNVVISRSDRIPINAPPAVSMSVTVPPQHRLGGIVATTPQRAAISSPAQATPSVFGSFFSTPQSAYKTPSGGAGGPPSPVTPHNYQISLPDGVSPIIVSPFMKSETQSAAVPITTQALLSSISTPIYSAVTPSPEKGILVSSGKARMASGGGMNSVTPKARKPSIGEDGAPEEYEPEIEFQPVVPLPEEVEVVTGEEDEAILFEERSKLFRFADETKEWKERGVGQAKILRNVETGKVRFLMRRDQTFKVCANHSLRPDMKLDMMKGNAKARIWGAQDFADGELKTEKFCVRFKTEEQAEAFQTAFLQAAKTAPIVSPKKAEKVTTPTTTAGQTLAQFAAAQKAGSWECRGCLTRNENARLQCLACEGAKPGHEEEVKKLKEAAKPTSIMTMGAGGGFKFSTTAATTVTTASGGFSFGSVTVTPAMTAKPAAPAMGFSFGSAATASATTTTTTSGGLAFGTPKSQPTATIGGFTFSTLPTVEKKSAGQEEKIKSEKKVEEAPKPSPFAGFSFGTPTTTTTTAKTELFGGLGSKVELVVEKEPEEPTTVAGKILGADSPVVSFVSLAGSEGFKADPNFKGFAGAGTQLFGGKKEAAPAATEEQEAGAEEEYEPDVQFQPVVPLPELIEVKTGEEEEDSLFSERCKLFRYVTDTKEWKERGLGDFKILRNRKTGRVRFLMRREQVLKICCNHFLQTDMEITPLQTSDRAWTWSAPDFAEGEVKNELFALKFKTSELAAKWKAVADNCQKELKEQPPPKADDVLPTGAKVEEIAKETTAAGAPVTLAQYAAAQKAGRWECGSCLSRNDNDKIQCLACQEAKPGHEEEVKKLKEAAKPTTPVMTLGAEGGFKFGGVTSSPAPGGFSFGTAAATSSPLSFGTPSSTSNGGFLFAKKDEPAGAAKPLFGSAADSHEFSFAGLKPATPSGSGKSPRKHNESTTSENELYQEEEDNLYFEPVIPLPDKVEVKTGEEEETVVYSHRAKVYRYTGGEWKERGVGDIKILKHRTSGKVRLLMRRDQVHKICLNHYVTPALVGTFKEKDPKSWTWAAQDYSDGELTSMTFALRSGTLFIIYFKRDL